MATWRVRRCTVVTIKVFFEGGADPKSNPNADTFDNTNRLREGFNKLLNSEFEEERVRIQAEPAYSITNVVKIREPNSLLLIDLDDSKDKKKDRIENSNLSDIEKFVFFMVQRMESWILSQPEVIEDVFAYYKNKASHIKDDNLIYNKHLEVIRNPDDVLNTIFQRYFIIIKGGKEKKLKYGKLKHSPDLIEKLDLQKLRNTFEDVESLIQKINELSI
ncbi:DUF4276 family protein [Arcicella sp. LKC2W]|uniref:DUF4276 family protein n=1 Tax=Arcicella sp. LKC2W TaxID=2984198 RepID=UPI002B2143EA|nr:DUF4276 family protein [Arcicella sp. LKC2W]MEA5460142.1 DUF4276 family protein [Arcicella sp. LKC2W]